MTRAELDTHLTGTIAGAGSFRCRECGFAVALHALDEVPQCPNCGNARFARASIFDSFGAGASSGLLTGDDDNEWIGAAREGLEEPGHYLAYREDSRVSVMPLTRECTRIGRSLTADIRFDDPTVSRRHAIIVRQEGVRVLDDRSLNGVFVNGNGVEWAPLEDGAELIIGRYRLHFFDTLSAASTSGPDRAGPTVSSLFARAHA